MPRPRGLSVAGDRIRDRRLELNKTQKEMANLAGIGASTWANAENGHHSRVAASTLRKVALALRVDMDDLVAARPASASAHGGS
jgi:transcriptional regulator with XRE-family HTH domain